MSSLFNLDMMSLTYVLVAAANLALVLLVVWFVGSLAVAAGFSERAEVLG